MASLTRNAENTPATAVIAMSKTSGRCARRATQALAKAKNPESRRLATTIIIPSSRVMVLKSMAL
jgi:hypothetical protein